MVNTNQAIYLLDRLGFGPRPGDLSQLQSQGWEEYLRQQLQGNLAELNNLKLRLNALENMQLNPVELYRRYHVN
jgi:hypothetical protein